MPNHLDTLRLYQAWRRGEDERVFEDIGLTPASIGEALDWAIEMLPELADKLEGVAYDISIADDRRFQSSYDAADVALKKYKEHTQ
jgi:hypothetical protein